MKTAIITGASSGIGRATAIRLSQVDDIDNLVLLARSDSGLEETASRMNHEGKQIRTIQVDLTDLSSLEPLVKGIYDTFGSIDILCNVAGYAEPAALLDTTNENIEQTYRVNVLGPLVLTRECVKYMRNPGKEWSKIVNVASTAGLTPRPGWIAYASAKAAVISMGETLTQELAEWGILVYTVAPGRCATEFRRKVAPEEDPSTIMQPEDVADTIADLLAQKKSRLDGQVIVVREIPHRRR